MWLEKCLGPHEDALWVLHIILYGKMLSWSFMDQLWSIHTLMLEGSTLAVKMDFLLLYDRWKTSAQACICCYTKQVT